MDLFGQIDLTVLYKVINEHKELIKEVQFKDGTTHKLINISVNERKNPHYGKTHYAKVYIKGNDGNGSNVYIADFKPSQLNYHNNVQQSQSIPNEDLSFDEPSDDFPFA